MVMNHNYYCLHTSVPRLPRPQFICMKWLAINANGNTITSFARELNPTGAGEYISLVYIYIYIYIYKQDLVLKDPQAKPK